MTTTKTDEPTGFDPEGWPTFASDELDARYADLLDRMRDGGADKSWFIIDQAVGELLSPEGALAFAEEFLELLEVLINRERRRVRLMVAEQERRLGALRRGLPGVD